MTTLDDEIARHLEDARRSGELAHAKGFAQPLDEIEGWADTPAALRMPFKILKDAGMAPPELALFHERAAIAEQLAHTEDDAARRALSARLAEVSQAISLRLESLRSHASI